MNQGKRIVERPRAGSCYVRGRWYHPRAVSADTEACERANQGQPEGPHSERIERPSKPPSTGL